MVSHVWPSLNTTKRTKAGHETCAFELDIDAVVTGCLHNGYSPGHADGAYRIGPLAVEVADQVAHLAGTDTIAGSTATFDRLFRFAVEHSGLPRAEALLAAARQSSVNPARALGLPSPVLGPGTLADLVVLDRNLAVSAVLRRGEWVPAVVSDV